MLKRIVRQICPPVLWTGLASVKHRFIDVKPSRYNKPSSQDLDLYWDPTFAETLETWGEGNVWNEIQFLMVNCRGRELDIACGTGKTMEILAHLPEIELHGCDISNFLIQKAIARGISEERLKICDATATDYQDNWLNYAYSIVSLEHFTEDGIEKAISECYRITKSASFHQIPVSGSGKNEGWTKTQQSFYNNSVQWWLGKFKVSYDRVYTIDSSWENHISVGKWFICIKHR